MAIAKKWHDFLYFFIIPIKDRNMEMKYAGFGPRLLSLIFDVLLFGLIWLPMRLLFNDISKLASILTLAFIFISYHVIQLYLLTKYGGSFGKLLARIRVRKVNGDFINFRIAFLRSSVDIIFSFLQLIGFIGGLSVVSFTQYQASNRMSDIFPSWYIWVEILGQLWFWGETIILLFNKKKRAIHDFIAGTVVIHLPSQDLSSLSSTPPDLYR